MKIVLVAVGRLKAGPERELFDRYLDRTVKAGRSLGLTFDVRELPESRASDPATRKSQESAAIAGVIPAGSIRLALDEQGQSLGSRAFAERLGSFRDSGTASLAFIIGGPDGLDPALIRDAGMRLAFGAMTWPHQLVRILLAEQLYRAVTILSGHPYHRD